MTRLSPLQWAQERLNNSERLAQLKSGKDRDGWLEDAEYWRSIIELIKVKEQA